LPAIDWDHPLSNGLLFYGYDSVATAGWNDNSTGGSGTSAPVIDLVTGAVAFRMGTGAFTSPSTVGTPYGPVYQYNTNNGNILNSSATVQTATAASNYTFACAFICTGSVGQYSRPFGRTANNGTSEPFMNWDFEINPGGVGQTVICSNVCASASSHKKSTNCNFTTGAYTTATATIVGTTGSSTLNTYINGALAATDPGTAVASVNTNDTILFGSSSGASIANPFVGVVFYGAFWNRVLSADEILTLHLDPYCFLLSDSNIEAVTQSFFPGVSLSGIGVTGRPGSLAFPAASPILFAGQEDLSFIGINGPISTSSTGGIVLNTTSASGQFRSSYARCSINLQGGVYASVALNTFLIRTGAAFSASTFWTSGRIWAAAGTIPSSNFPFMRWLDANGVVRLLIATASNSGSILSVYKVNAAGTQTQLGFNTTSGVSASPATPDKIDVYIDYTNNVFTLYINGTRVFNYLGDLTTDGNTSLSYVDYGMAVGSSNAFTASNHWSECIVATQDTRQMSLVTQVPGASGNTTAFTSGAASNVNGTSVSPTTPDYSSSVNQVQQYQVGQSIPAGSFSVISVVQHAQSSVSSAGPQHFQFSVRSGGADYFTSNLAPSTGWSLLSSNWDINPNTATTWQTTDLPASSSSFNFGYKSTA
jgi:hypothetical protein